MNKGYAFLIWNFKKILKLKLLQNGYLINMIIPLISIFNSITALTLI